MVGREIFSLVDKVALVVGGTGGMGKAIALGFAQFGADVIVAGRDMKRGREIAQRIQELGRRSLALKVDVTRPDEVNKRVEETLSTFDRIDILVNCAGINRRIEAEKLDESDWDAVVDVNLKGTFLVSQAVGRAMIAQGGGKIINISSIRGEIGMDAGYTAYCASKAGVNMFTKQLANEWGKYNINVNAIAPGWTRTALIAPLLADEDFQQKLLERTPLRKVASPDDMVGAAIFLASSASDFVTGHVLTVDGGLVGRQ